MSVKTEHDLNPQTIDGLQDLIQINLDSAKGFLEAAKRVESDSLKILFTDMARVRENNAIELQTYVERNGEHACQDGSLAAAFHRVWLDFRGRLAGGDALVILSEAERGEDHIKAVYEDVLVRTAGRALNNVLIRQYSNIKTGHHKVRDLRDAYK